MKQSIILTAILSLSFGLLPFWEDSFFAAESAAINAAEKNNLPEIENRLSVDLELSDLLDHARLSNPSITASNESRQMTIETYRMEKSYPDKRDQYLSCFHKQ